MLKSLNAIATCALLAACTLPKDASDTVVGSTAPVAPAVLEPYVERGELPGAVVLVTSKSQVLEFSAIGYSNVDAMTPMRRDSLFWIASTSKEFVGTATMMMVEEGKISLDAPVVSYLPDFAPALPGEGDTSRTREITIRQLLSHTSGLPGRSAMETPTLDLTPLSQRVDSYGESKLFAPPGTAFIYGNADVNTVARVIEVVTGQSYETFLGKRLLEPLGLSDTTFCPSARQLERLVTAYTIDQESKKLVETPIPSLSYPLSSCRTRYAVPAGGLFSTATDLARFARMILNGGILDGRRYLTAASIEEMTRNQLSETIRRTVPLWEPPHQMGYGLAWGASLDGSYFHPGSFMTDLRIDPSRAVATILMFQMNSGSTFAMREHLLTASDRQYARP